MVISSLHGFRNGGLRHIQSFVEIFVEFGDLGRNWGFRFVLARQHIGGLQTVASDAKYGSLVGRNAALPIELVSAADSDPARSLGKNALGLCQKLDGRDQFGIRYILSPAA